MGFSSSMAARFIVIALVTLLAGCNAWDNQAEFAAPQSRWPADQPSRVPANAPPPAIPVVYCYHTLASVDCYTEARPDRITGYTGVYPNPDTLRTPPSTIKPASGT